LEGITGIAGVIIAGVLIVVTGILAYFTDLVRLSERDRLKLKDKEADIDRLIAQQKAEAKIQESYAKVRDNFPDTWASVHELRTKGPVKIKGEGA